MEKTVEAAIDFVNNGGKCVYRYGWAWKGAGAQEKTKEWALEKLNKGNYSFGKGFYELSWLEKDGETILGFNELSENDMW